MFHLYDRLIESARLALDKEEAGAKAIAHQEVSALLEICPLKPNDRVLDLCCGKGYHAMDLAARGYRAITGVDSPRCGVPTARRKARLQELSIPFTEFDVRRHLLAKANYDAVFMHGNSFGNFPVEDEVAAILKICRRALCPWGVLALSLIDGDWLRQNFVPVTTEVIPSGGLIIRQRTLTEDRLTTNVMVVEADDTVVSNKAISERIYTRSQIERALRAAGFCDVTFGSPVVTAGNNMENGVRQSTCLLPVTARAVPKPLPTDMSVRHPTRARIGAYMRSI